MNFEHFGVNFVTLAVSLPKLWTSKHVGPKPCVGTLDKPSILTYFPSLDLFEYQC